MRKKNRVVSMILAGMMVVSMTACSGKEMVPETTAAETKTETKAETEAESGDAADLNGVSILHLIPNTRGDGGNHDMAASAVEKLRDEYSAEVKIVEMGNNSADIAKYLPTTLEGCEGGAWDYILTGTAAMVEPIQEAADMYPDQKFLVYDAEVTRESEDEYPNVYSAFLKANESSFVTGALGMLMSDSDVIGFVGGTEITTIYDFLVGYVEGAKYVKPESKVLWSFVGSWNDLTKAKELASVQYNQGASVILPAAGQAYAGAFEAGYEMEKMYFGCDVDRTKSYESTVADMCNYLPTSVIKKMDQVVLNAFERIMAGENIFGKHESLGIAENCVGIVKNDYYKKLVPEAVQKQIDEIEGKIAGGEIEVDSAFDMTQEEVTALISE